MLRCLKSVGMMIFNMSCALEIPEANVGRSRLCFVVLFRFARGLAKAKCGGI